MNLTEKSISKLTAGRERVQHLDEQTTGFGIRVEPNGRKSFFWFAKVNGKPRFRALGEFPTTTVADARTAAKKFIGIAATWKQSGFEGLDPFAKEQRVEPATVPSFQKLIDAYVQNHVKETANNVERGEYMARWTAKKYFADWTERPIDEITVEDVLTVKNACGKKKYAANRAVEFIRTLFNWSAGRTDGKIHFWPVENPAKDIETFEEKPRKRFLQPGELVAFNECLKTETHRDLKDFLTLALATGARRGDVLSMRWQDLQWERLTWVVPYPKNGESYDVQLMPAAVEVLKRRRAESAASDTFVFPGLGKTGHLVDLKKPWNEFRKKAKIADVRVHDLRRTVGSYQAIAGVSLQQIGGALGHKSLQSTQVYAHLHGAALKQAREAGQAKMHSMMKAAKRAKITAPKPRLLKMPVSA